MGFLAVFEPKDELTAIFLIAAVVCFGLAAFAGALVRRAPGGSVGLVAIGLGLFVFPTMWQTAEAAF